MNFQQLRIFLETVRIGLSSYQTKDLKSVVFQPGILFQWNRLVLHEVEEALGCWRNFKDTAHGVKQRHN